MNSIQSAVSPPPRAWPIDQRQIHLRNAQRIADERHLLPILDDLRLACRTSSPVIE